MQTMKFKRTWRAAQAQATTALKQYAQTDSKREQAKLMALAQACVVEAVGLDGRAKPEPWGGDKNH